MFRRRRVFVCVAVVVLAVAAVYSLVGARYEAQMKILVRRGRADAPVSAGENAPLDLTRIAMTEEELNSEVELLRDDDVLRQAVAQDAANGRDWLHFLRPGEGAAQRVERAARRLGKKLVVEPVKKTNLIAIKYAADDPQSAARMLQSVADAYLKKHAVVHRPSREVQFFEQLTRDARRDLEEAERKLQQFTAAHGVVAAAQERDLALQKLSEIDGSYRQTRIDMSETQQRVTELQKMLTTLPERTTTQVRIADNPELMKALKSNLLDLQEKRTQLLTKFEPSHRLVQEVDQQITQAEAAVASEMKSPLRDETTDKDAHYEWAKSELERAQVQLKALQSRGAETGVQEASYRTMARSLGDNAVTQDDLQNTEKAAEESYLLLVKKQEQARMADALDQSGIVNVAMAEPPVVPALPASSAWTLLAIGLVAAGTAGTGAAFAADYADPAFRTPDDVLGVFARAGFGVTAAHRAGRVISMSAQREVIGADLFPSPEIVAGENFGSRPDRPRPTPGWTPENFAREQIQGLVRQVFLSSSSRSIRQVVFSAVDAENDVRDICRQVGEALAGEAPGKVGVMGGFPRLVSDMGTEESADDAHSASLPPLRRISTRVRGNLWLVPGTAGDNEHHTAASLHSYLGELRREFEYSIVEAAPAGEFNDTMAMAQFADGIILVLSAGRTRKVAARKVKQVLEGAQVSVLGTILSDRVFSIPERIYRRL
jgi:uncharacterized protein involved in exopolysaccharide biosynthesis